jgi:Uncharacterized alpha/beta hydrolase domain (DUF2235)
MSAELSFAPTLWHLAPNGGPKDLKQVWFPGVHCDIGGGYPKSESGLSRIALEWMIKEAVNAGLFTDDARANLILGRRQRICSPAGKRCYA